MLTTISIGTCVTVQGILVKMLSDGRLTVRVGDSVYCGRPVREPETVAPASTPA
ncbi:MAG: hypothetical protein CSA72_06135 [Rhodobacterales bacterium]|nr:MAG: hypothetical protein CSA72_06135 [Rhodobacterales bacterium]